MTAKKKADTPPTKPVPAAPTPDELYLSGKIPAARLLALTA